MTSTPRAVLTASGPAAASLLRLHAAAVENLDLNTVVDPESPADRYFRAGGGYQDPWTRDASINSWFAGSLLDPVAAEYTLRRVTQASPHGAVLAQDDQWWDQAIWVVAAWNHWSTTGSKEFLRDACGIAERSLAILRRDRFDEEWGLHRGPGFMQDGISGLPTPPNDASIQSSFVLDYPQAHRIATLSSNALTVGAYRALAAMRRELGLDASGAEAEGDRLAKAVQRHFLAFEAPAFLLCREPGGETVADHSLEAAGVAFAVLFNLVDSERGERLLADLWQETAGVVNVWPHFADRYDDERPGRHNVLCWPVVMGLVTLASASISAHHLVDRGIADLTRLVEGSGGSFFETYQARTGSPDGGWQVGREWDSQPDQTWSATAFIVSVHAGILRLGFLPGGAESVTPRLPEGLEAISLDLAAVRPSEP